MKDTVSFVMRSLGLRNRYLLTRASSFRLRYMFGASCSLALLLSVSLYHPATMKNAQAYGTQAPRLIAENSVKPIEMRASVAPKIEKITPSPSDDAKKIEQVLAVIKETEKESVTLASFYKKPAIAKEDNPINIKIQAGQTVSGQLTEIGVPSKEAHNVVEALKVHYDLRKVRAGQSFEVEYQPKINDDGVVLKSVSKMTMPINPIKQIVVYRQNESFKAEKIEKQLETLTQANKASIKYSLYGSAAKSGIPDSVISKMIKIFSWNVDFQRDIRSGDEIEVLYETKVADDGTIMGYGEILYARLVTGGQDLSLYRHKNKDGHVNYFDPKGASIKRTLMKTPIDGARMSSGFGMRRHPVLGYNKMHKGTDFAAPTGTPIYAAGDGVIEEAGRKGSYGKYVRIRHNSKLKTAYAHMHRIKSGMRPGARVKQGQVIGTVGTTGRSTGPHLHYEVIMNGKQVNPRGVNVPVGETLSGKELKRFKANKVTFDEKFVSLTRGEEYAAALNSDNVQ